MIVEYHLRGYCTLTKINIFCVIPPNYQHNFGKSYMYLIVNRPRNKKKKSTNTNTNKNSRPSVFKLWIKTVKIMFVSISQEPLGLLKF